MDSLISRLLPFLISMGVIHFVVIWPISAYIRAKINKKTLDQEMFQTPNMLYMKRLEAYMVATRKYFIFYEQSKQDPTKHDNITAIMVLNNMREELIKISKEFAEPTEEEKEAFRKSTTC
jgi:hypothetical protein